MRDFFDKAYRLQVYKLALGKIDSANDNIWWRGWVVWFNI